MQLLLHGQLIQQFFFLNSDADDYKYSPFSLNAQFSCSSEERKKGIM